MRTLKAITQEASQTIRGFMSRPSGSAFSDVILAQDILTVTIDALALVILRSLKDVKSNTTLSRDLTVSTWANSYPKAIRSNAHRRLTEAWHRLNQQGFIVPSKVMNVYETWFVTEAGIAALERGDWTYIPTDFLPRKVLVPRVADVTYQSYLAGRFDDACAAGFKEVEVTVRTLAGLPNDCVGLDLMRTAFKPETGPLTINNAPKAEQIAVRDLFCGAIGYFRNPLAHRKVGIDEPAQAASFILFANELVATAMRHHIIRNNALVSSRETDAITTE